MKHQYSLPSNVIDRQNKISKLIKRRRLPIWRTVKNITFGLAISLMVMALSIMQNASQMASALTITSVDINQGPVAGQNEVTIHGSGFLVKHKDSIKQISDPFILTNDGKVLFAPPTDSGYADFEHIQDITDKFELDDGDKINFIDWDERVAISTNGDVYEINLDDNNSATALTVNKVNLNLPDGEKPLYLEGGLVLSKSGRLYSFESDDKDPTIFRAVDVTNITNIFNLQPGDSIKQISNDLAISNDGNVYLMKYNDMHASYSATDITNQFNGDAIKSVSASNNFVAYLALSTTGNIYAWGDNVYGQLGLGDTVDRGNPTKLEYNFDGEVTKIFSTASSSYASTDTGKLYAWGYNGNLGIDSGGKNVTTPTLVSTDNSVMAGKKIIGLSDTGGMAWDDAGNVFAWGRWGWSKECLPSPPQFINYANRSGTGADVSSINSINCNVPNDITNWFNFDSTSSANVTSVEFGGLPALKFDVVDSNTIKAVVPASKDLQPGKVDVELTDNDGHVYTLKDGYEYVTDDTSVKPDKHITPTAPNTGAAKYSF